MVMIMCGSLKEVIINCLNFSLWFVKMLIIWKGLINKLFVFVFNKKRVISVVEKLVIIKVVFMLIKNEICFKWRDKYVFMMFWFFFCYIDKERCINNSSYDFNRDFLRYNDIFGCNIS